MTAAAITVTERDYSPGMFDMEVERPWGTGQRKIAASAHAITAEQVEALTAQLEALDADDDRYFAQVWAIMRSKGGAHVIAFAGGGRWGRSGDNGTIHKALCSVVLRKMTAVDGGSVYDVRLDRLEADRKLSRSPLPKVCRRCCADLTL